MIARGLKDTGMEVIYLGLRLTPEQITVAAVQEDVDVVGLSCLAGAHMVLFPEIANLIREMSDKDVPQLREAGIAQIFGPGKPPSEISRFIETNLGMKSDDSED